MRSSDQLFEQSVELTVNKGSHTSIDENIARFLTTSAHYFMIPADRLEKLKHKKSFTWKSRRNHD